MNLQETTTMLDDSEKARQRSDLAAEAIKKNLRRRAEASIQGFQEKVDEACECGKYEVYGNIDEIDVKGEEWGVVVDHFKKEGFKVEKTRNRQLWLGWK